MITTYVPQAVQLGIVPASFFHTFRAHYLAAALQLCDEELGSEADESELSPETARLISEDCATFLRTAFDSEYLWTIPKDNRVLPSSPEQAGTDFWLSRNGHGAGYFDRPKLYGEQEAEQLQELAEQQGSADLYRGDNGQIYQQ